MDYQGECEFDVLLGKTLSEIEGNQFSEQLIFHTTDGDSYRMFHDQNCCESVYIEDITGDLSDLLNSPIIQVDETSNNDNPKDKYDESCTWTFYRIATSKGSVVIRWYGSSNGYYSERVTIKRIR